MNFVIYSKENSIALKYFHQMSRKKKVMTFGNDGFSKVIAYIYDHFDEFKLILTSGENSTYQEFIHRIIELDISCTMQFIEQTGNDALSSGRLTPELAHLLSSAFLCRTI